MFKKFWLRRLVTGLFVGLSVVMFSFALTVYADTLEEGVYNLVCVDGGRYLNVYAGQDKNGANLCVWTNDGSKEQNFKIVNKGRNKYVLYPQSSSERVVDVNRGNSYKNPLANGNNIDIWQPNDASAQQWYIDNQGSGKYKIELMALRGSVMTADKPNINNGNVSLQANKGKNNQLWYLKKVGAQSATVTTSSNSNLSSLLGKRLANFNSKAYNASNPLRNYKDQR